MLELQVSEDGTDPPAPVLPRWRPCMVSRPSQTQRGETRKGGETVRRSLWVDVEIHSPHVDRSEGLEVVVLPPDLHFEAFRLAQESSGGGRFVEGFVAEDEGPDVLRERRTIFPRGRTCSRALHARREGQWAWRGRRILADDEARYRSRAARDGSLRHRILVVSEGGVVSVEERVRDGLKMRGTRSMSVA